MKQVILDLDDATAAQLERIAPTRARKRSAFLRAAIRRAIDDALERETEAAYRRVPDSAEPWYFDADAWSKAPRRRRKS
jgi:predicted transcriptional regulator